MRCLPPRISANAGMIAGNAVMDRNGPPGLLAPAAFRHRRQSRSDQALARHGRQRYAVTPRFAITSTDAQLAELGGLVKEFPTVLLQTHLDENLNEIAAIKKLFPTMRATPPSIIASACSVRAR